MAIGNRGERQIGISSTLTGLIKRYASKYIKTYNVYSFGCKRTQGAGDLIAKYCSADRFGSWRNTRHWLSKPKLSPWPLPRSWLHGMLRCHGRVASALMQYIARAPHSVLLHSIPEHAKPPFCQLHQTAAYKINSLVLQDS